MSRNRVNIYGQDARKNYPISIAASSDNVSVGAAAGSAATVALPALTAGTTEGSWVLGGVVWSYSAPVTTGGINVADSSGSLISFDIHAGSGQNFGQLSFEPPLASQVPGSAL